MIDPGVVLLPVLASLGLKATIGDTTG